MSLKKLNMNSMKVAQPMGNDAMSLLVDLAKKYENNIEFSPKFICENENKDVTLHNINTDTTMEITLKTEDTKSLGVEIAFILKCMQCGMSDAQIIENCNINESKLLKAKKKLNNAGYLESEVIYRLKKDNVNLVPVCEPIDVKEETIEQNKNKETDMTPQCLLQDNVSPIEIADEHFMTIPTKPVGKTQDEILFDLNQRIYMDSHAKQNKKGEVFKYENSDRASLAEMEMFPPKKKYHTTL